jgi:nucleotide-binding universal stress UspA family protein
MWGIKTILHPTDFSPCSQAALHLACSLARDRWAHLIVLHVTSVPDLAYTGYGAPGCELLVDEYIAKAKTELARLSLPEPPFPVERRLEEGDPAEEILRVAAESGAADLIVMGTHGARPREAPDAGLHPVEGCRPLACVFPSKPVPPNPHFRCRVLYVGGHGDIRKPLAMQC